MGHADDRVPVQTPRGIALRSRRGGLIDRPFTGDDPFPYGSGWSIRGLQKLTTGTTGSTEIVTDGSRAPELFTSTNGVNYTGDTTDTSTLTYHPSTLTWTRSYVDGTVLTFDVNGLETSGADANGNTTSYSYVPSGGAGGALQTMTDPVGLITTLAYDANGHLSSVTDPAGRVTTFTVDSNDNLLKIVDPDGAANQYAYSSSHQMTAETNPDSKTATIAYDGFGLTDVETLFDGSSQIHMTPAQEAGLLRWGDTGTSLPATMAYYGAVSDPNNGGEDITFDNLGGAITFKGANAATTQITRNGNDWPTAVKDPLGRVTSYSYDQYGDVTNIGRPDGGSETLTYNSGFGIPTEIADYNGNTTTFVLDSHGNITEEMRPDGVNRQWTYNSAGLVLTAIDGNSKTTSFAYDSLGRTTTITEPGTGSPTIRYGYNAAGDVTSITDEVGDTTTMTYDPANRVLSEANPVQTAAGRATLYVYDAAGNLVSVTDANLHTTTYGYDARNELVNVTDPLNHVTTYAYDPQGELTSSIDPLGNRSTFTYDYNGNRLTAQDAVGTVTYSYDIADEMTTMTDARGDTTLIGYSALGKVNTVTLPGQAVAMTYGYDHNDNLKTVTDQNNHSTTYTYDKVDQETVVTDANGHTTSYTYDGEGNRLTVTDPLMHTTSYSYDAMGDRLTATEPAGGGTTTYTYSAAGDLLTLKDPVGNTTSYTYDAAHEVATRKSPTGGVTTYTYDLVGNLTQTVDPDGHTIQYGYDAADRATTETWVNPLGGSLDIVTYTYDADGELTKVSDNNATYEYTYNARGQATSQADIGSANLPTVTLTYGYDPNGNRTSLTDSLGGVVSYTYDARNQLTDQKLSGTGISAEAVTYTYDPAGNLTGLTRYSNLAETTVVASTTIAYDPANRLTGITDKNSGGTTLVSYGTTYDAAGRVSQEARTWNSGSTTDTLTYGYTNNNQLTGVTHTNGSFTNESFNYDANGNRTGTGYTTTTGNEQTASPGYTYTYDADGNMITATQTSSGNVWTYSYDFRNRTTGAVEKTSGGTVLAQVTYTYDVLDNRIGMDENGTQTWTLFDGPTPIMDFSGSSTSSLTMRYLWGPAGILSRQSSGGTVSWYLSDRLGTIRDLINNSGSIIDHVDYSAFGTVLDESSPSNGDRMMGFAGLERDGVMGLNLAVYRVQDPGTGRWSSVDPISFNSRESNLYRYVVNSPSVMADPLGLEPNQGDIITLESLVEYIKYLENFYPDATAWDILNKLPAMVGYKFVYMCKGGSNGEPGYIDTYHFFNTARWTWNVNMPLVSYYIGGYGTEILQSILYIPATFGVGVGQAASAWGPEDIPSDYYGAMFGPDVYANRSSARLSDMVDGYFRRRLGGPGCVDGNKDKLPPTEQQHQDDWWAWWMGEMTGMLRTLR